MCTAITWKTKSHYFGRNLDLEYTYNETVTITPRNFPLSFRCVDGLTSHCAMIGMATVVNGYPLYYEATNEHGLSIAGLNFPGNAVYLSPLDKKINIAPFELIPWLLGQFKTLNQVKTALKDVNLVNIPFNEQFPLSPLHWIIADSTGSLTVEPTAEGLQIYDNPVGVLTNNPPFPFHLENLNNYLHLTADEPIDSFCENLPLEASSRGLGALGLPGDVSSPSRFVRAAFIKHNSVSDDRELLSVSQFFHILNSVSMVRGCVRVKDKYDITAYTCCCNSDQGTYYYTTYDNQQITAIQLRNEDLDSSQLRTFPLIKTPQIRTEN